jgi:hypothetical protein
MISDVVLEHFRADDVFAVAPVGKRQKCSAIPELIRDTFRTARMTKSTEVVWEELMTHSSGLLACILSAFVSAETKRE